MKITAGMVSELRKATGSGLMDCKKALTTAEGDMDNAIQILREKGMAKAAKRANNETKEGKMFVKIAEDNSSVSLLKLTCETEPVAKNEMFLDYGKKISELVFVGTNLETEEVTAELTEIRSKLGENITIAASGKLDGDFVSYYIHSNGKVGVTISLELSNKESAKNEEISELAKNLTLQIASLAPKSISSDDLDPEFLKQEMTIIKNQLKEDPKNAKKPENILEKIVEGRKGKVFGEVCLLEQEYVKEKIKIKDLIADVAKANNTDIKVAKFIRYQIGGE